MKDETLKRLRHARSLLGTCASKVAAHKTSSGSLVPGEAEKLVGFGTARDWIRWAVALEDLKFSTRSETKSARGQGILESVRFNQMWTSANALFAKDSILTLAASVTSFPNSIQNSEAKRFEVLYQSAALDPTLESACVGNINSLLSMECRADSMVGVLRADGTPTMWEIIYHKYMRPEDRTRPMGSAIGAALNAASVANAAAAAAGTKRVNHAPPAIQGPALIYAARNWAVHGMLITSFFRGSHQKYITFINNITLLLAAVLEGASKNLLPKL
ncbi:hypothetical protein OJ996_00945 [Luteolibacter sp. GHJ8]|uniref:Uncharacterized protein n=1 Tax=Luteolibacter rhizosphaerae TaxID=2989719 RepID=A0ABT3FX15_9BACT|nr:hypothetical protein [Luteolibacter rhizosphaerae]MCW1912118.1 hypothetical protein [Luteolibacter rhizosphaerae]